MYAEPEPELVKSTKTSCKMEVARLKGRKNEELVMCIKLILYDGEELWSIE